MIRVDISYSIPGYLDEFVVCMMCHPTTSAVNLT